MRTAVLCIVCGIGAFFVFHLQFSGQLGDTDGEPKPKKKAEAPKAKFPEALAPAAHAEAVPQAAVFSKTADFHPSVAFDLKGNLHPWHERLRPAWTAETVEATELVLVLGKEKQTLLQVVTYPPQGAAIPPPVRRYRYDMDAWLVEARTGQTITSKRFTSIARSIRPTEHWELTELGDPIQWVDISRWMREEAAIYAGRTPPMD